MGLFDRKKEKEKPDFSDVQSGASTTSPVQQGADAHTYTVKPGDTLSAIAQREYGNAGEWRRIYEANRDSIEDPDLIHPGQQLNIPDQNERGGFR